MICIRTTGINLSLQLVNQSIINQSVIFPAIVRSARRCYSYHILLYFEHIKGSDL